MVSLHLLVAQVLEARRAQYERSNDACRQHQTVHETDGEYDRAVVLPGGGKAPDSFRVQ